MTKPILIRGDAPEIDRPPPPPQVPPTPPPHSLPSYQTLETKLQEERGKEVGEAVEAFVKHPEFPIIYNRALSVSDIDDRWSFLLRRAYELGDELGGENVPIGHIAQHHTPLFQKMLEPYGLRFLCPYFKLSEKTVTGEKTLTGELCTIDYKDIDTTCGGKYQRCTIFQNRTAKAAIGEVTLPEKKETLPVEYSIPRFDVEKVDIDDLHDWWQGEGKYE